MQKTMRILGLFLALPALLIAIGGAFDGDTGAGVGASHQTGWTGAIARLMQLFATASASEVLVGGKQKSMVEKKAQAPARKK